MSSKQRTVSFAIDAGVLKIRTDVLAGLELGVLLSGENTEGVGTEVVTLCLENVRGNDLTAVAVEERQGGGERGHGDTPDDTLGNYTPPAGLRLLDGLVEEVVEEKGLQVGSLGVRGGDIAEEDRLDDATTTPHTGNSSVVQVPVELVDRRM